MAPSLETDSQLCHGIPAIEELFERENTVCLPAYPLTRHAPGFLVSLAAVACQGDFNPTTVVFCRVNSDCVAGWTCDELARHCVTGGQDTPTEDVPVKPIPEDTSEEISEDISEASGCEDSSQAGAACGATPIMLQPGPVEGIDKDIGSKYNPDETGIEADMGAGGWGDQYYALIRFGVTALPATASKVTLRLYPEPTATHDPTSMYLDRVTESWDEGTSWATRPTFVNIATVPACSLDEWCEFDITAIYLGWKQESFPNWGLQLRPSATNNNTNSFYTSDYMDDPTLRPMLVVTP